MMNYQYHVSQEYLSGHSVIFFFISQCVSVFSIIIYYYNIIYYICDNLCVLIYSQSSNLPEKHATLPFIQQKEWRRSACCWCSDYANNTFFLLLTQLIIITACFTQCWTNANTEYGMGTPIFTTLYHAEATGTVAGLIVGIKSKV